MTNDPDLIDLKTTLLNQVGSDGFFPALRHSVRFYLNEHLNGYQILSSSGRMLCYQWDAKNCSFTPCGSPHPEFCSNSKMDLKPVHNTDALQIVEGNREALISIFYRSICYHHLLIEKPDEANLPILLTQREKQVMVALLNGCDNRKVAQLLGIQYRTVEKHCENIFRKLGVENRNALMKLRNLVD